MQITKCNACGSEEIWRPSDGLDRDNFEICTIEFTGRFHFHVPSAYGGEEDAGFSKKSIDLCWKCSRKIVQALGYKTFRGIPTFLKNSIGNYPDFFEKG